MHEFPQRDEPYFESLGKQSKVHTLTGFIVGPDCFEQRDRLLQALEQEGAGELVHPWLGRVQVQVGECGVTHNLSEGGLVRLDLKFYPANPLKFPVSTLNTRRQLLGASEPAGLGAQALPLGDGHSGRGAYQYSGAAQRPVGCVRDHSAAVHTVHDDLFGCHRAGAFAGQCAVDGQHAVYHVLRQFRRRQPSSQKSERHQQYWRSEYRNECRVRFRQLDRGGSGSGSASGSNGTAASSAAARSGSNGGVSSVETVDYRSVISEATQQAEAVSGINLVSQSSGLDTGVTAQAAANLVQDALLVKVAKIVASMPVATTVTPLTVVPSLDQQVTQALQRVDVPVADDVIELRDTLSSAIWEASLKADPEHYLALNTLRQALIRHLNAVAASGVRLVDMKVSESLPALVLAYRRFGDASRAQEMVQRNRLAHPGFVPPGTLKIAQE